MGSFFFQPEDLWQMRASACCCGPSPSPLYTDSITAAPEVPAIRGSWDETQDEISIRWRGLETEPVARCPSTTSRIHKSSYAGS